MKEQSHKEEMSKALRGDFERLRDRGVASILAPRDDEPSAGLDGAPVAVERSAEDVHQPAPPIPEGPEARAVPAVPEGPPDDVVASKPGLFGRLLGR